ncbi:MAG TPA: glycosyltransferase family 4 protein [Bacteroidia bacterium]|nr:glycosyltransferase family 4 protein [Bacteroidia bacterium]
MKIALLTDGIYPYVIGGMQKFAYQLVQQLVKSGHEVYLFHCNQSKYDINKLEFFSEAEKKYIKSFVIPFPHTNNLPFHYFIESRKYAQSLADSLSKVIDDIDFIFVQGFCASALPATGKRKGFPPVALHLHGLEMFQNSPSLKAGVSKYMFRKEATANLKKTDYTVSFGGKITDILQKFVKKKQIWEIPGGIDESWLTPNEQQADDKIHFVFLGRYERRKGIIELNAALKMLLPKGGFTFDFIGPIPEEHKINSSLIRYHGQLSGEAEIKAILSKADVLVCPSYAEGMPYVIMEAMACGMAIIATDVGAVSLLVNNKNGWLIDSPDVNKIANAMLSAINEKKEVLEQKKAASVEKIKEFTFEKVTNQLIQYMEESKKKVSSLQ